MNEEYKIPTHVAIIMDGNGRWAKMRGLKRSLGHKAGADNLESLARHVFERGVKVLSIFAFSTENFKRDKDEVDYLMDLFASRIKKYINKLKDVKVVFSGRSDKLPSKVLKAIEEIEEKTKDIKDHTLNICINYGGRAEIVDATKKIAKDYNEGKISLEDITEDKFKNYLYNDLPDVDFLIRTSGELRISNFLLYELAYSEMYFPDTYFPDFDGEEFDKALDAFNKRDRRFGGVKEK